MPAVRERSAEFTIEQEMKEFNKFEAEANLGNNKEI